MFFDSTAQLISQLLTGTVAVLDIPPELRRAATAEYERVGNWLADYADGAAGWVIYPQGSFLLNTVVLPGGADEYDVDSVCLREVTKEQTSQRQLKYEVGDALDEYRHAHAYLPDGPVSIEERSRCWTNCYPAALRFHLDVLPAIPNPERGGTAILITDRALHEWQRSDPRAYATWFADQARGAFLEERLRLAEAARTEPAAIPDWEVRTVLQRVVQVLKVHRNNYFAGDLDSRPASILVSTLAAHAYSGERDLYDAVLEAAEKMPAFIQKGPNGYSVPNPVEPREDFADRWGRHPEQARRFFEWLNQLGEDLREAESTRGLDRVASRLQKSFGQGPVERAAASLGDEYRRAREDGKLGFVATTGVLSTTGSIPVRRHDFYGEIS
ncbi:MAG: hypothetical protein QOI84_823 [Solirubrobacterales bacterium]|jgi:hypothetical protein|nr:hypothetical protein [Solirubrobacterales bacterium]